MIEEKYYTSIAVKNIRNIAKVLSYIFRPAHFPFVGFCILLFFTYLNLLPLTFKLWVLTMVWICTIGLPHSIIFSIRKFYNLSLHQIHMQHRRPTVYITNIICYLICLYLCKTIHLPMFLGAIIVSSLLVQCVCVIINIWHHISLHSAGTGLIIGTLLAYSFIFNFNPTWWLILATLISGAVMSSRMILTHRTLGQVISGTIVGIVCGFISVILS